MESHPQLSAIEESYGLQVAGWVDKLGLRHNGPRFVVALGKLIMASGPALCSPLNGVGWVTSKPQVAASFGLLNQNPTWKVFVGERPTAGSKPKIWLTKILRIVAEAIPALLA